MEIITLYFDGTMTKSKKCRLQVTWDMIGNLLVLTVCLMVISAVLRSSMDEVIFREIKEKCAEPKQPAIRPGSIQRRDRADRSVRNQMV